MYSFRVDKSSICSSLKQLNTKSSVLDNYETKPLMEMSIFRTFQIDLLRLIKNKVVLCKNFNLQPSEIDRMCFYEYEYFIAEVQDTIQREQEAKEEQENNQNQNFSTSKFMRQAKANMPNFSTMKYPKLR